MCIYFIHNLSKKAKSHHLITLLPYFTLICFYLRRHSPCFDAVLEIRRGRITRIDDLENDQFQAGFLIKIMSTSQTA